MFECKKEVVPAKFGVSEAAMRRGKSFIESQCTSIFPNLLKQAILLPKSHPAPIVGHRAWLFVDYEIETLLRSVIFSFGVLDSPLPENNDIVLSIEGPYSIKNLLRARDVGRLARQTILEIGYLSTREP
ncbi:MAG: hypothetical protein HYV07_12560 [Deltaproteobacteria bacterium]|nr:hypothetical protein [Deltaproteobacteria bacterium]